MRKYDRTLKVTLHCQVCFSEIMWNNNHYYERKFCSRSCFFKTHVPSNKGKPSPMRGIPRTDEEKKHMSLAKLARCFRHSEETKRKISKSRSGKCAGEESPHWISDRSLLKKADEHRFSSAHREWSRSVKNRDGWHCKIANGDCSGRMEAHHILSWSEHPGLRYEVNNGITLCHFHHPKKREDEKRLIADFQRLVSVSRVIF